MESLSYRCNNGMLIFNGLNDQYGLRPLTVSDIDWWIVKIVKQIFIYFRGINLGTDANPLFIDVNSLPILNLNKIDLYKAKKYNHIAFLVNLKIMQIKVNAQLCGYTIKRGKILKNGENLNVTKLTFNHAMDAAAKQLHDKQEFIIELRQRLSISFKDRSLEIISIVDELGKGKYTDVYKIYTFTKQTFQALKINITDVDKVTREFHILQDLAKRSSQQNNFQTAYQLTTIFNQIAFQGPLYSKDLYVAVMGHKAQKTLSQEVRMAYCRQLCLSLKEMFALGYTHGDLKPDNVLLTDDNYALIADFGDATHDDGRLDRLLKLMHVYKDFHQISNRAMGTFSAAYLHRNCVQQTINLCYSIFLNQYNVEVLAYYKLQRRRIDQQRDVFALVAIIGNILTGYNVKPTMNQRIVDNETLLDDDAQWMFDKAQSILTQNYAHLKELINDVLCYSNNFCCRDAEETMDLLLELL